jgi:hypothetical protein
MKPAQKHKSTHKQYTYTKSEHYTKNKNDRARVRKGSVNEVLGQHSYTLRNIGTLISDSHRLSHNQF